MTRHPPATAGELNYTVSTIVWEYLKAKGINYDTINTCIGALECAKLELYRRVAAGYEDEKLRENGEIYK